MIFTKGPENGAGRFLTVTLLLMLMLTVAVEARERHSENLLEIAHHESEKRYSITWWLNSTGIAKKYSVVDADDVTPSTANRIYEEVFNRKMELFIGGYQLKFLKLLVRGNDTVEPGDIVLLLRSFTRNVFEAPGNEYKTLLGKILSSTLNPTKRKEYKFSIGDIDKLVFMVAELGERSNVSKEYVFSIAVKLELIKLATRTGIYEDAYSELLNDLLMKESILMAFLVDRVINDLQVNIVKREFTGTSGLRQQLEQVTKNAPLTRSDVLRVLNYTRETLQNTKIGEIDIGEILSTISTIISGNMNVEYLGEILQQLGNIAGENLTSGTPLSNRDGDHVLVVETTEPPTGGDDVRMNMRKYNYSVIATEELEITHHFAIYESIYFESLSEFIEKINSEKLELYTEFRNAENPLTTTPSGGRGGSIYIVQGNTESEHLNYLQYTLITLPLLLSLIVAYKKGVLATVVGILKEWSARRKLETVAGPGSTTFKDEKTLFFERFWNMVHKLSSEYNVSIAKSTTHREAYTLLSSRIKDLGKITVLEQLVYSYEYARYGGMELDVKPLLQLIDSLK